jgi:D-aminopeptidase
MSKKKLQVGRLPSGKKNCITDVSGIKVGHVTLDYALPNSEHICTGVTAILPHGGNLFREKVVATSYVINGFGKTTGLIQLDELGLLESPIMLTNTFGVPAVTQGTLQYMLEKTPEIGDTTGTVNIVVGECNDGYLNSIRQLPITPQHALKAIESATEDQVAEGAIGAGKGMVCFGYKGGIGTSSRIVHDEQSKESFTVGCLVLSNFGRREELKVQGRYHTQQITEQNTGQNIEQNTEQNTGQNIENNIEQEAPDTPDGSIMIVVATDAPLSDRQLKRVAKRCSIGLGRAGSHFSNGSGDIVIAFSTAHKSFHDQLESRELRVQIREDKPIMNELFTAGAEVTEEAILHSLLQATTTKGRLDRIIEAIPADVFK